MARERSSLYDTLRRDQEENFSELQQLLVGEYIHHQHEHEERLEKLEEEAAKSSQTVARNLAIDSKTDPKIRKHLYPVIEDALRISVEENPSLMAGILFPIVGEAVRKAVAHAMQQVMDSTNEVLANSFSAERIGWRIEAWRSGKSFAEIALAHSLSYRVEHIYVIHRTTGLLLGQVTNQANLLQDSDMVVGMLTAIQDFVRDSFTSNKQADLDVIQVGEFKIWLQHGPIALLAAVISGQPKASFRDVLVRHVEDIHKNFHSGMARFETTGQAIPGIEAGLDDCLVEEVKEKGKKQQSYTKFKVAGVVLLIAACVGAFFYIRRALNWSDYVQWLRHQPGLVVIDENRTFSTLTVRGLRDPMATDPEAVIEKFGLAPSEVSEYWEPYYSLDPRFANARRLANEADALRKRSLRFQLDSTELPMGQVELLDAITQQVLELQEDAARQKRTLRIHITGHTDSTGTSEHNDQLSRDRAESVARFFISRGVNPNILSATGVGYKQQPGYGPLYQKEQNLDRRVIFNVELR